MTSSETTANTTEVKTPTEQALLQKRYGNECFVQNNYPKAIEHYTSALDLIQDIKKFDSQQKCHLFANRAECYIRLKQFSTAIKDCEHALKCDNGNIKAHFRRAKANEALKKYKLALKDLQFVIKKDINNDCALDLMRIVRRKLGMGTAGKSSKDLNYDPETDVSEDDQQNICLYNVLNHEKIELEDDLQLLKAKFQGDSDAEEAVEMLLDDDACRISVGNCFLFITNEETEEYLKADKIKIRHEISEKQKILQSLIERMTDLRSTLKAKFGDHIGLPELKPSAVHSR